MPRPPANVIWPILLFPRSRIDDAAEQCRASAKCGYCMYVIPLGRGWAHVLTDRCDGNERDYCRPIAAMHGQLDTNVLQGLQQLGGVPHDLRDVVEIPCLTTLSSFKF